MASRLTVSLEEAFSKRSRAKKRFAWIVCALLGLTLASELGKAQSNTSHPPVISTSTQWTLDAPVLASADSTGNPGNNTSLQANFSPDGTHLLFWSRSTNLVAGATNTFQQLYLKDLTAGQVSVVSADVSGAEGNGNSMNPNNPGEILMFSPDGTKVVFQSIATNLVAGGSNGFEHIFVKDLTSGMVTQISASAAGAQGNASSMDYSFSPDGTRVVFASQATNLTTSGTSGQQVFVKDLSSSAVTLVSVTASGSMGSGASSFPVFSPDGTQVAFVSTSTNLAPGATNNTSEIYIKNLLTGSVTLASADPGGNEANGDSLYPMFSPDGSKLAFNSVSTNFAAGLTTGISEVYVKDLVNGTVTLVSADATGVPASGSTSMFAAFSPDSTKIAFQSSASNLLQGGRGPQQVIVRDLLTGAVTLASTSTSGTQGNSSSAVPAFSPSHLALAFQSDASNFGVTTFTTQVYVRPIFTASGAVADNTFSTSLSTAGQLAFSDPDVNDTHTVSVATQSDNLGTLAASLSKDSTGTGTGGVALWNYQVNEVQLRALNSPATDNFTLTLTDSQGCTATTAIVVTALPQDFAIVNATNGNTSVSSSTSSCPTLLVTSSPSDVSVTAGQPASFSASATGTPTPTVQWQVSTDGGATFTDLQGATSTTLTFTANTSQSGNLYRAAFTNSSGTLMSSAATLTVTIAQSSTTLTSSKISSIFGQPVTFTATVSSAAGTPTGTVTFNDGSSSIGTVPLDSTSAASLTTSSLAVGTHTITASYSGDANSSASNSAPLSQVVNRNVATVTLNSSSNPSLFGQAVTFAVVVSAASGTPTGTVTFSDGSSSLGAATLDSLGSAAFTTSSLAVGSHSMTAVYNGDATFSSASSAVLSQSVTKDASSMTLSSSANPSVFGQPVVITATVSAAAPGAGTPSGTITFTDGTTSLGSANLVNGQASLTLSALAVSSHSITANYAGDGNFNSSSSTLTQTVSKASTATTLTSSANPSTVSQSVTFTATVSVVAPGAGTPTGSLTFSDGSNSLATVPLNSSGTATFSTSTFAVALHSVTAVYSGDANFNGSTGSMTQNVEFGICAQYDQTRSVQGGATFPIRVQVCDGAGNNLSSPSLVLHGTAILAASGVAGPVQDSGNANPDNDFRNVGGSGQNAGYIFNLTTNGLTTGTYALHFTVTGDPVLHTVFFGVN